MRLGTVRELWRYPVKSMAGERLGRCCVSPGIGIHGDRGWALRDEGVGEIRGAKKLPALMRCAARYRDEPMGAEVPPVEIALGDGRVVQSDEPRVAAILSEEIGRDVTLWPRRPPEELDHYRLAEKIVDLEVEIRRQCGLLPEEPLPELGEIPPELLELACPLGTYFDAHELHLITSASLAELARCAPGSRIDVRRFRPNILVETAVGMSGLPEFEWCGRELRVGDARTHALMPTLRCAMTTWAQADLPQDLSIMRTLVRETGQNLGIGLSVVAAGTIRVGDRVELVR
jgi:uncharacterized protein YcbX